MIFLMITEIQKWPKIILNTVEKSICKLFIRNNRYFTDFHEKKIVHNFGKSGGFWMVFYYEGHRVVGIESWMLEENG